MTRKNKARSRFDKDSAPISKFVHNGQTEMLLPLLGVACIQCENAASYMNVTRGLVHHVARQLAPCQTKG